MDAKCSIGRFGLALSLLLALGHRRRSSDFSKAKETDNIHVLCFKIPASCELLEKGIR